MVFGLFSRKPAQQPAPMTPDSKLASSSTVDIAASVLGLRTPSPSVASGAGPGAVHSPAFSFSAPGAPADGMEVDTAPSAEALHSLVRSVPPKILHEYVLEHLHPSLAAASPLSPIYGPPPLPLTTLELNVLATFFSTLAPPPLLHCVRCHNGFFDVENTDRSCTMAHDDDAAEVERVGAGRLSLGGEGGAHYETLWGCCGRTVEGDGDMGPPDGWCYEGKHTTDPKRARFRADSTPHDDKLSRCTRRCPPRPAPAQAAQPPPSSSGSSSSAHSRNPRKRTRSMAQSYAEPHSSDEEEDPASRREEEEEEAQSSADEAVVVTKAASPSKPPLPPTPTPKKAASRPRAPRGTTPARARSQSRPKPRPKVKAASPPPDPTPTPALRTSPRKPVSTASSVVQASRPVGAQRLTRAGTSMGEVVDSEEERAGSARRGREKRRRVGA
ncbi:hypothetical protein HWV62_25520 [Athelia sp. TMB]|nr:hypothetical protein HWV62_25520 [Athelia sp. TMB]